MAILSVLDPRFQKIRPRSEYVPPVEDDGEEYIDEPATPPQQTGFLSGDSLGGDAPQIRPMPAPAHSPTVDIPPVRPRGDIDPGPGQLQTVADLQPRPLQQVSFGSVMPISGQNVLNEDIGTNPQAIPQNTATAPATVNTPPPVRPYAEVMNDRLRGYQDERVNLMDTTGQINPENKVVDKNGRIRSALYGAGVGLAKSFGDGQPIRGWNDFAGRLGGGIGGAVGGAIRPQYDEELQRQKKIAQNAQNIDVTQGALDADLKRQAVQSQIELNKNKGTIKDQELQGRLKEEQIKFEHRLAIEHEKQKAAGKDWEPYYDKDGKVSMKFKDGHMEKLINPDTGEQDINPGKVYYEVYDPVTKQKVRATGESILASSQTRESGDLTRAQDADKTNAANRMAAQRENANNFLQYNSQLINKWGDIMKASGEANKDQATAQGYLEEMNGISDQLKSITDETDPQAAELMNRMNFLSGKVRTAISSSASGRDLIEQMKAKGITPPQIIKPVTIKAQQSKSREVPHSKDPAGLFR